MAEEESFENLDDLDWSDVESELKATETRSSLKLNLQTAMVKKKGIMEMNLEKGMVKAARQRLLNRRVKLTSIFCLMYSFPLL